MIKMENWMPALENMESRGPGTLSEEDYAKLMMGYIYNNGSMTAKFLFERIPNGMKEASQLLKALVEVARNVDDKMFANAHSVFASLSTIPEGLIPLSAELSRRLQEMGVEHIRRVYDVITLERFAVIAGFNGEMQPALDYAGELGFHYDANKHLITIAPFNILPESTVDDENWGSGGLDSLDLISDTVTALRKTPFFVPEVHK